MTYHYKTLTADGKTIRGKAETETEDELIEDLKARGQTAIKIRKAFTYPERKIGAKQLSIQARQLGFIYSSGAPIKNIARIFSDSQDRSRSFGDAFTRELLKGAPLSDALGKRYPEFFLEMVKIGEKSGTLATIFKKLTSYYENQDKRETQIKIAALYPSITFLFLLLAFSAICLYLAPAYSAVYTSMQISPPPFLKFFTNFFANAPLYLIATALISGIIYYFFYRYSSWIELKIPLFKKEFNRRFAFALSIMYESGINIQESLRLASRLSNNKIVTKAFELINRRIAEGMSMSAALSGTEIFEPLLTEMIKIGENIGFLSEALAASANYLEAEAEAHSAAAAKLAEPVMTLILGAIIFAVVAAVMAPAVSLSSQIF